MGLHTKSICFRFAAQHTTLSILQMTIICSWCQILLIICQQEQQRLLFGRLHWEQHSSQMHQNRQLQQLPELNYFIPRWFCLAIFYARILKRKQTLVTSVVKPSHLPHSHSLRWQRFTHGQDKRGQGPFLGECPSFPSCLHLFFPLLVVLLVGWLQLCLGNKEHNSASGIFIVIWSRHKIIFLHVFAPFFF